MNNAIRPSFNENFTEFHTCGSREQCMEPTKKCWSQLKRSFQLYPNLHRNQLANQATLIERSKREVYDNIELMFSLSSIAIAIDVDFDIEMGPTCLYKFTKIPL